MNNAEQKLDAVIADTLGLLTMYPPGSRIAELEPLLWKMMSRRGKDLKEAWVDYQKAKSEEAIAVAPAAQDARAD